MTTERDDLFHCYEASTTASAASPPRKPSKGVVTTAWRGATGGVLVVSSIGVPVGAILVIADLMLGALAAGSGRGFAVSMWTVQGLGVARSIGDEPTLVSQLVRIAIDNVAVKAATRTIGQGEASDAALRRLQADLLSEYHQPLVLYGIKGERAMMVEMIRRIADGEIPIDALSADGSFEFGAPVPSVAPWGRLAFENQMALALEFLNEAVAIARLPAHERPERRDAWEGWLKEEQAEWHARWTKTMAILLTPGCQVGDLAHRRAKAELGAMVVLVAAERHRLRQGDWPRSVEDIDDDLLPEIPRDPFSGDAFLVHRPEGRFVVASIGPNGLDDGGEYDPMRWTNRGPDDVGAVGWDVDLRGQPPLPFDFGEVAGSTGRRTAVLEAIPPEERLRGLPPNPRLRWCRSTSWSST